jgi:hypothetical protein
MELCKMNSKLTKEEINYYLHENCTLEIFPRCSECDDNSSDVYTDDLDGIMYCKPCLVKSIERDVDAVKELREALKESEE